MILPLIKALCLSLSVILAGRTLIHWFQLESYQFPGYFRTVKRRILKALVPGAVLCALYAICAVLPFSKDAPWVVLLLEGGVPLAAGVLIFLNSRKEKAKKPLVYTARMKRLLVTGAVVNTLVLLLLRAVFGTETIPWAVFLLLLPLVIALDGLLAWPLEKLISEMYFRDAQRILRERPDLIKIGITGSWGKTSVKFILGQMLQDKYNTLVTPASFNTPMGVTRIIRTKLEPGHRVFIAEMGARHVGDIKEMCRLVHPDMGVLTSVGPQHLDTFHTLERVINTKYELIEAIPREGSCFFADDDGSVLGLYEKTDKEKYLAGLRGDRDDVWAEDIRSTPQGSTFTLCIGEEKIPCKTELLGELNIRNIVLGAAVCLKLGMTGKEISHGIAALKSVEHRLQLIRNPGGVTVIDDAFNSNIRGAEQAFNTLKDFPGRKVVVTPGMVELGNQEEDMNREFGRLMAGCCDLTILVGRKHTRPIAEGLREKGFPEQNIVTVGSLAEATEYMTTVIQKGDTILFENDLPDNYKEE